MSKGHPEDNAQSRFTAFWMIVISLIVFVIAISFVLCYNNPAEKKAASITEDNRAADRVKKLAVIVKDQQALLNSAAVVDKSKNLVRIPVADGMNLVLPELRSNKAAISKVVLPGSPTSLKAAQVKPAASKKKESAKPKKPEAKKPEAKKPEVKKPEVKKPAAAEAAK